MAAMEFMAGPNLEEGPKDAGSSASAALMQGSALEDELGVGDLDNLVDLNFLARSISMDKKNGAPNHAYDEAVLGHVMSQGMAPIKQERVEREGQAESLLEAALLAQRADTEDEMPDVRFRVEIDLQRDVAAATPSS